MEEWIIEYVDKKGTPHDFECYCEDERDAEVYTKRFSEWPWVAAVTNLRPKHTETLESAIQPTHYRKGDIDLYESWYRTRPFNEVRAILESIAERYIKRDKNDRVKDISKAIYTLERLREYEVKERENE